MFKSKKLAVLAALLSLLVLLSSLMAVPVFADETTTAADTVEDTTKEETTKADETTKPADTTTGSSDTKKEETTTGESESEKNAKKERLTRSIINLSVGALIVIAVVVLAIKFRSKIPTWWKGLKSECGKITWCPKEKLKKNTIVVVIIILVIAVAIGVLDFVFSRGMILLGDLFH